MHLWLWRDTFDEHSTTGQLYVDGPWRCFTLEDRIRAPGVKVKGQTCIPAGTYRLILAASPHFGRMMPCVIGVLGFSGILIHWGVRPKDTEGCVLVGQHRGDDSLTGSQAAFDAWFPDFAAAIGRGEACDITIENDEAAQHYGELTQPLAA